MGLVSELQYLKDSEKKCVHLLLPCWDPKTLRLSHCCKKCFHLEPPCSDSKTLRLFCHLKKSFHLELRFSDSNTLRLLHCNKKSVHLEPPCSDSNTLGLLHYIEDWGFRAQTVILSDCYITLRKAFIWSIHCQTLTLTEWSVTFQILVNPNNLRLLHYLADSCKKSIHLELLCSGSNILRLLHCLEDSYQKGLYLELPCSDPKILCMFVILSISAKKHAFGASMLRLKHS